jgi:hypothetical protein
MSKWNAECQRIVEENLDKKYAIKLTERIVFGMVGIIVTAFLVTIINNALK